MRPAVSDRERVVADWRAATPDALYRKLKPGPGLSPEQVIANQRARLCGAMIELCAGEASQRPTVRSLSRVAGVSTKTFYECFSNVEDCFASTHTSILRDILQKASAVEGDGDERIRGAVEVAFLFLAENPKAAHFLLFRPIAAGSPIIEKAHAAVLAFERHVGDGVVDGPQAVGLPPLAAHAILGGAMRALRAPFLAGRSDLIPELAGPFADWLLGLRDERLAHVWSLTGSGRQHRSTRPAPFAEIGDDRQFLLTASLKLSAAEGYESLTVPSIRREAGVPRRAFDDHFDGVEDCFLSAVEALVVSVGKWAAEEARRAGTWDRRVVRMLELLAAEMARDPAAARLGLIGILAPGLVGLKRREDIVTRWAGQLRRAAPATLRPSSLMAEISLAAVWRVMAREVAGGRPERIRKLVPGMAFVILAPAIGPADAERAIIGESR
jgi:AcrR family transcriptional regulator